MEKLSEPYIPAAGHSRRDDAFFSFKATAVDTGGLGAWEFTLGPWDSGPVLHLAQPPVLRCPVIVESLGAGSPHDR